MFGSPETQPGGRALKFYASVRIDLRRIGQIKDRDEVVGNRVKATVVKNKVAPPFRRTEFDILFNQGISREGDAIDTATLHRVIEKSGSWLSYKGERLGQGRDKAKAFLLENPDLLKRIEDEVRAAASTAQPGGGGGESKSESDTESVSD
jgi:recombination protein RecA